jgi:pyruvate/2-oxoglutarate dehydrogenase complex dihydrolipoamide acyltransferase (E2) component
VRTEIRLAQAGMAMTEGEVIAWHKRAGDTVESGDLLAEVEAAKTTIEVEAPCSGILAEIAAQEGAVVPVRGLLAVITDTVTHAQPASGERRQVEPAARRLAAELAACALGWARDILRCSPASIRLSKRQAMSYLHLPVDDALATQADLVAALLASPDASEGTRAFVERREPRWAT